MEAQILEALLKLTEKKQIGDITIRDIAGEAGVSLGSIYNKIGNKSDIVNVLYLQIKAELNAIMINESSNDLESLLDAYITFCFTNKVKYNYIFSEDVKKVLTNASLKQVSDTWLKDIRKIFPPGEEEVCILIMFGAINRYISTNEIRNNNLEKQMLAKFIKLLVKE